MSHKRLFYSMMHDIANADCEAPGPKKHRSYVVDVPAGDPFACSKYELEHIPGGPKNLKTRTEALIKKYKHADLCIRRRFGIDLIGANIDTRLFDADDHLRLIEDRLWATELKIREWFPRVFDYSFHDSVYDRTIQGLEHRLREIPYNQRPLRPDGKPFPKATPEYRAAYKVYKEQTTPLVKQSLPF